MNYFPVDRSGKPSFSDDYSERHRGIDIFAPRGTQVLAVDDGQVRLAVEAKGGTVAYLKTADATYFYGHLERFLGTSPREVKGGDVIGFVGTTGNAAGTAPHVHFQMAKPGEGNLNPYPSLARLGESTKRRKPRDADWTIVVVALAAVYLLSRRKRRYA